MYESTPKDLNSEVGDTMAAIKASKASLRNTIKHSLKQVSMKDVVAQTQRIQDVLFTNPEYQSAKHISIYLSMPTGEVSTQSIVEHALQKGKTVFVPYLYNEFAGDVKPSSVMDMVSLYSKEDYDSLKIDKWGIPTPEPASVTQRACCLGKWPSNGADVDIAASKAVDLDLIIMPGLGFDHDRGRLGHGRGYYDVFLHRYRTLRLQRESIPESNAKQIRMPFLMGLALQEQVLPRGKTVPTTSSDWQLDAVMIGDGSIV